MWTASALGMRQDTYEMPLVTTLHQKFVFRLTESLESSTDLARQSQEQLAEIRKDYVLNL